MNTTFEFAIIFGVGIFVLLIIQIINLVVVRKLTKYLREKYPKEFEERKIAKTSYQISTFSSPKNIVRLHTLPYLIVFTNRLHMDEFSTGYAKKSRMMYTIVSIIGLLLIGYILTNAATGNL